MWAHVRVVYDVCVVSCVCMCAWHMMCSVVWYVSVFCMICVLYDVLIKGELGLVEYTCDSSTCEGEAGGL